MIAKRFLAIFQPPLLQDKITVITESAGFKFYSSGKIIIDEGYTKFTGNAVQNIDIPNVKENETLYIEEKTTTEKTSVCPKRFTDGTLVAAMEKPAKYLTDKTISDTIKDLSIGTSATRDAIITKLIKDKYIIRKGDTLMPTDFGAFMIHTIRGISLCQIDTTGQWEQMLAKVREGELSYEDASVFINKQVEELIKDVKGVNKVSYGEQGIERKAIMTCPGCGKDIMEAPRNYYCSGYRDGCKYSIMKTFLGAQFTPEDVKVLFNGGEIEKTLTKKDKTSSDKTWKQKLRFDKEEGKLNFVQAIDEETALICPECKENLYKKGKRLHCHSCEFGIWYVLCEKELTEKELDYILKTGKSREKIDDFKSKTGKKFKAKVVLKKAGKDSKLEFKFD